MPSLVNGRAMNSYDYDRGPARLNGLGPEDDMRRDEDDRYRRRNGGPNGEYSRFNTDHLDQTSLSDFRSQEPKFELDHLATFAAGARQGCLHAEDGLRKLRQMENTTGIWTMRCVLIVERNCLVILDNSSGEELERFPVQLVQEPTAIFKNDRREIYNNLILFTIGDDPKKRNPQADMHIFQSCKAPAQEIVDEILAAKGGQQRVYPAGGGSKLPPPPVGPAPEPPNGTYDFQGMKEYFNTRQYTTTETRNNYNSMSENHHHQQHNLSSDDRQRFTHNGDSQRPYSYGASMAAVGGAAVADGQFGGPFGPPRSFITRVHSIREKEDIEGGSNEILERDVQLLNHCFDDIEKFVARLQQAAESFKELEKRKKERGAKNKKRQSGDGMLTARARPPPDRDFVDIFQKFKLSFNLLAKLKAHIHDPNAPELVHFLFTPLSLIYEASRDPYHGNQNLGDQAVAPVLTAEAKQLLLNCLTSKEIELWQALGKHWTTSRVEWNGHIPPYVPEFYDGWQPAASVIDDMTTRSVLSQPAMVTPLVEPLTSRSHSTIYSQRPTPFPDEDRPPINYRNDFDRLDEPPRSGYDYGNPSMQGLEPPSSRTLESREFDMSRGFEGSHRPQSGAYSEFVEHTERRIIDPPRTVEPSPPAVRAPASRQDENSAYFEELKRGDVIIYEAAHDRQGKNSKELTVQKGDVLQVLDNSKNWWKLRNYCGEVGFCPYTILKPLKTEEDQLSNGAPLSGRQTAIPASEGSFYDDNFSRRDASKREVERPPSYQRHNRNNSRDSNFDQPDYMGRISPAPQLRNHRDSAFGHARMSSDSSHKQRWSNEEAEIRHHQLLLLRQRQRDPSPPDNRSAPVPRSGSPPLPPPAMNDRSSYGGQDGDRYEGAWKMMGPRANKSAARLSKDDHQEELHARVTGRQQPISNVVTRITKYSTPNEVILWLDQKGFSDMVLDTFQGYTGWEMYQLRLSDLQHLLGHEEAIRLDGLLTLQKNTSGYVTRSAKELNDILQRRKEHVSNTDPDNEDAGDMTQPPVRMSSQTSLRDQLVRQRSRLRTSSSELDLY